MCQSRFSFLQLRLRSVLGYLNHSASYLRHFEINQRITECINWIMGFKIFFFFNVSRRWRYCSEQRRDPALQHFSLNEMNTHPHHKHIQTKFLLHSYSFISTQRYPCSFLNLYNWDFWNPRNTIDSLIYNIIFNSINFQSF